MPRLSTTVDLQSSRPPRSTASATRAKVVAAARVAFSRTGFDQLGVREIAASAGVDPAVVIRLFGSKEALFAAVADGAFALEAPFEGHLAGLGLRIAKHLTGPKGAPGPDEFDELAFLMRSAGSPTAAPLLSKALHAGFVGPLARLLGGKDATLRAALMTACVLGYSTLRFSLGSPALDGAARARVAAQLGAMLQTLVL
jgi:AcrR family transcriptional regulator